MCVVLWANFQNPKKCESMFCLNKKKKAVFMFKELKPKDGFCSFSVDDWTVLLLLFFTLRLVRWWCNLSVEGLADGRVRSNYPLVTLEWSRSFMLFRLWEIFQRFIWIKSRLLEEWRFVPQTYQCWQIHHCQYAYLYNISCVDVSVYLCCLPLTFFFNTLSVNIDLFLFCGAIFWFWFWQNTLQK